MNKSKRMYVCPWNIGDVFEYRIESELAKSRGLYGKYFLVQKVDETTWYPGHIIPIVYVKIATELPRSLEEYNRLEFVQTSFSYYEERFWPVDMSCPEEDIAQKSKIKYEVDEYGFLPQYRISLIITSTKKIPQKLIYVGNFAGAVRPPKEFVPHAKINIGCVEMKENNGEFEKKMIERYFGHNLREFEIYKKKSIIESFDTGLKCKCGGITLKLICRKSREKNAFFIESKEFGDKKIFLLDSEPGLMEYYRLSGELKCLDKNTVALLDRNKEVVKTIDLSDEINEINARKK